MPRKLLAAAVAALACAGVALAGTARRASLDSAGAQAPFASFFPAISGDGRVVVFRADGDLIANDIPEGTGYYARDLAAGTITRLPDDRSYGFTLFQPFVSADGRTIVVARGGYGSRLGVLAVGAGVRKIAELDSAQDVVLALSGDGGFIVYSENKAAAGQGNRLLRLATSGGAPSVVSAGDGYASAPAISADGRYVAFLSSSSNLVPGDTNGFSDIFVKDMKGGAVKRLTDADANLDYNIVGQRIAISGNGRLVAYAKSASGGGPPSAYVIDTQTRKIRLVSSTSAGKPANGFSGSAALSTDGRYVAFSSTATNLVPGAAKFRYAIYRKDLQTGKLALIVGIPKNQPAGSVDSWAFSGDGQAIALGTLAALDPSDTNGQYDVYAIRVGGAASAPCRPPTPIPEQPLTPDEQASVLADQHAPETNAAYIADIKKAIAAAQADGSADEVAYLQQLLQQAERSPAAAANEAGDIVEQAKCRLLDDAKAKLSDYLDSKGHGDKAELADKLSDLKDVFAGDATDREKEELLKANVTELIERIGGKGAAKKYAPVINDVYRLVQAKLEGDLGKEARAQLKKRLIAEVKKASQKLFGRDAPALVDQILTLRDVLSGDASDAKKLEILKQSVTGLATRLFGEGILDTPQARAAMLGFELGRVFGESIAADLEIIANKTLASDCAVALGPSQSTPGAIDYSQPATGIVPKGLWHEGWRCDILPQAFVEGVAGGLVQATRPDNASAKDKLLWRITTSGTVVTYDPSYSR